MSRLDAVVRLLAVLGALAYLAAGLGTVADIVLRAWGGSIRGIVDYVQLCVIAGTFAALPYAFLTHGHVRVDLLLDLAGRRLRTLMMAAATLLMIALTGALAWFTMLGLIRVVERGDITMNVALPMTWHWTLMTAGLVLSLPVLAVVLWRELRGDAADARASAFRDDGDGAREAEGARLGRDGG